MNAHGQQKYQVRLDHGIAGAGRIAPGAHLVVVVDALDGHGLLSTDETVAAVLDAVAEGSEGADRSEGADDTERGDGPVHAETCLLYTSPSPRDGKKKKNNTCHDAPTARPHDAHLLDPAGGWDHLQLTGSLHFLRHQ
ncbi:hypothetical protein FRIG_13525, partial [Frigoribacterium faeni]|nr:hypothetical protein [Frigoribacterium faeni]